MKRKKLFCIHERAVFKAHLNLYFDARYKIMPYKPPTWKEISLCQEVPEWLEKFKTLGIFGEDGTEKMHQTVFGAASRCNIYIRFRKAKSRNYELEQNIL